MKSDGMPYLIVGQGIAGTLMAWQFLKKHIPFLLIDKGLSHSASSAAAGIVNPVTGRRVVKSWMIDQLLPVAKSCYQEMEEYLNIKALHEQDILRSLFSVKEENVWVTKSQDTDYADYISADLIEDNLDGLLQNPVYLARIRKSFRVDLALLLHTFRQRLQESNSLIEETFDYTRVELNNEIVRYKSADYQGIIFCEGWNVSLNPWFKESPLALNKGEALSIRIHGVNLTHMLKHKLFFVPQGNHTYWVGSNYQWEFKDDLPTKSVQMELQAKLKQSLLKDFEVLSAHAGIRPSTDQRRPILGTHPQHKKLFIFNGMGTKGTSLAPYWSDQLVKHILMGEKLPKEVDIRSFLSGGTITVN